MAKKKRRMAGTKEQVVLRLLRGEDMELVSRETGFQLHEVDEPRRPNCPPGVLRRRLLLRA